MSDQQQRPTGLAILSLENAETANIAARIIGERLPAEYHSVCFSSGLPIHSSFLCSDEGNYLTLFRAHGAEPIRHDTQRFVEAGAWQRSIHGAASLLVNTIRKRTLWDLGPDFNAAILIRRSSAIALGGRLKNYAYLPPVNLYLPLATESGHAALEDLDRLEAEFPGRFYLDPMLQPR